MKKVVIAIDYHPSSEKVTQEGYKLAETHYYSMNYPSFLGYDGYSYAIEATVNTEIEKIANDFLKQATAHLNDDTVKTHIAKGETATSILNYAKEWQADLIVMGTHSHSALEKLLMGTEATKVLEKTEVPVFMVPVKK